MTIPCAMFNRRSNGLMSKSFSSFLKNGNSFGIFVRHKSNGINVSNYETGFNSSKVPPKDQSLVDELDLLSLSFEPNEADNSIKSHESSSRNSSFAPTSGSESKMSNRRSGPNRSLTGNYPTGGVAKQRCYNCGQMGHVSFDCQQPQVRKACYTCGNSGHLARDCPQSQRPIICYVCRQPGHLASKCPSSSNNQYRSNNRDSKE